jgi:hypothetical protein
MRPVREGDAGAFDGAEDWDTWLAGPIDEAMALQRPLPDAMLRVVAAGDKTDGTKPA